MNILTVENKTLPLSHVPEEYKTYTNTHYCVLDYTDKEDVDYKFFPLVNNYLETFNYPGANLQIGKYNIKLPLDWCIIIGDKYSGDLEIIELKQINGREFNAFAINPISGFMPDFLNIEITDIFTDVAWCAPKLKQCHILAIPLEFTDESICIFCCKDKTKIPDVLDITSMV